MEGDDPEAINPNSSKQGAIGERYSAWMFVAGLFGVLVMVTAILARSFLFGVVAAFLFMLACNRQMERNRVNRWLARPTPEGQEERVIWARIVYDEMRHPSVWLRITEWISAIAATGLVVIISIVLIATTGLWMRLLYGRYASSLPASSSCGLWPSGSYAEN